MRIPGVQTAFQFPPQRCSVRLRPPTPASPLTLFCAQGHWHAVMFGLVLYNFVLQDLLQQFGEEPHMRVMARCSQTIVYVYTVYIEVLTPSTGRITCYGKRKQNHGAEKG